MAIKVEILTNSKAPTDLDKLVNQIFDIVPKEHTRGISKVVVVNEIKDPRLLAVTTQPQPILYHPKTPGAQAFVELALDFFLAKGEGMVKRLTARLNFKTQVAGALLAAIGQHYHFTYSHGIKKANYEVPVRQYIDKHIKIWGEKNVNWRTKLFKPLQPLVQRLDKWLRKKMAQEQKKPVISKKK